MFFHANLLDFSHVQKHQNHTTVSKVWLRTKQMHVIWRFNFRSQMLAVHEPRPVTFHFQSNTASIQYRVNLKKKSTVEFSLSGFHSFCQPIYYGNRCLKLVVFLKLLHSAVQTGIQLTMVPFIRTNCSATFSVWNIATVTYHQTDPHFKNIIVV